MDIWRDVLSKVENKDPEYTKILLLRKDITDEHVAELCEAMEGNTTVTALYLSRNNITARGVATLASHITAAITYLQLSNNQIGDEGAVILSRSPTLLRLQLNSNEIGYRGVVALARNTTLSTLCLQENNVDARGAIALSVNTTLRTLGLNYNNIGDCAAIALARNTTLTELGLADNDIGDCAAIALAHNTTLIALCLALNQIGDDGATALAYNSTLATLDLQGNAIGLGGARAFARNTTLTSLYLDGNIPLIYAEFEGETWTSPMAANCAAAELLASACRALPPLASDVALEPVAALLRRGIRPYGEYFSWRCDGEGKNDTLLHLAVRMRQSALVDLLLAHGAAAESCTENSEDLTYRQLAKSMGVQLSSAYFGQMPPYY